MDIDQKLQQINSNSIMDNLHPSVKTAVKNIIDKECYIRYNVCVKTLLTEGGNYLGALYEIDIKGETAENNKVETNIFVKQVLPNGDNIQVISVLDIYSREVLVYTELANLFTDLQNNANIPNEKTLKIAKVYEESNIKAIILENVKKKGFKTFDRMEVMGLSYAQLCLEQLAKFHGLGFLIEIKMPDYFERNIKPLYQPIKVNSACKVIFNNMYELATTNLSSDQKLETNNWWKTALDDYTKYLQGTMTVVKSLCHGDFKMNNIMYKEINGNVSEVMPVDYQIAHYGSPVLDLIYFLYTGTDQTFRRNYLEQLKDYYYLSLKTYLEYFDVLVEDVYPKKTFDIDFKDCLSYGLISCIWILPFVMVPEDEAPDISSIDTTAKFTLNVDDRYYERLTGVFSDYFNWD